MHHRQATAEELLAYLKGRSKVSVRHFVKERALRTAANGVQHVQRSTVPVEVDASGCYCVLDKQRQKITASAAECEGIRPIVYDVRLDNPYLPKAFK